SPEQLRSSTRAGLYAGLILLSSFGIFIFTRIIIPDAIVCLWLTLALYCYWLTENDPSQQRSGCPTSGVSDVGSHGATNHRSRTKLLLLCWAFAACCAL